MRTHGRFLPPSYPMPATAAKKKLFTAASFCRPLSFSAPHMLSICFMRGQTRVFPYGTPLTLHAQYPPFLCHCRSTPGSLDLSRVKAQGEESPPPPPPPASQAAAALFKEEENQEQGQHGSPKKPKEEDEEEEECGDKEPKEEAASSPHHALQAAEEDRVAAAADNSEPENDGEKLGRGEDGEATPEPPRSDHGADGGGEDQDAAEDEN